MRRFRVLSYKRYVYGLGGFSLGFFVWGLGFSEESFDQGFYRGLGTD